MYRHPRTHPTLVDALPRVLPGDLIPGDLLAHRGRPGFDEAGGRLVNRVEPGREDGWIRIVQPYLDPRWAGEESAVAARADQGVYVLPPYWPHGETRPLTHADVLAAQAHVGNRAVK